MSSSSSSSSIPLNNNHNKSRRLSTASTVSNNSAITATSPNSKLIATPSDSHPKLSSVIRPSLSGTSSRVTTASTVASSASADSSYKSPMNSNSNSNSSRHSLNATKNQQPRTSIPDVTEGLARTKLERKQQQFDSDISLDSVTNNTSSSSPSVKTSVATRSLNSLASTTTQSPRVSGGMVSSSQPSLHFVDQKLTPAEQKVLGHRRYFEKAVTAHTIKQQSADHLSASKNSICDDEDLEDRDIIVCIRARPLLTHEVNRGIFGTVTTNATGSKAFVHALESKIDGTPVVKTKDFEVDCAFGPDSQNEEIYQKIARNLIPLALGGGVGSLFAYGQTGSGKTFTMTAMEQRIARDIFDMAKDYRLKCDGTEDVVSETGDFDIRVCFIELFGNTARDLLAIGVPGDVQILEDVFGRIQIRGALEEKVTNSDQLLTLIERGASHRRTEGTSKNATSSRSHAVCRIRISNQRLPEAEDGLLYLLDLAGSESAADTRYHAKERIQESVEINKSLSTLKDCIRNRAMAAGSSKHIHIPYRNSRLTVLLKEAFELESTRLTKTVVIAALSSSILDLTQSQNTLRYIGPLKVSGPKKVVEFNPDNPAHWSNEQLRERVVAMQPKRASGVINPDVLCPTESGKQIMRLPEAEFIERCLQCPGVSPKYAKEFYLKLWKLLVDARTKVRKTAMKEVQQRIKKKKAASNAEDDALWEKIAAESNRRG